MVELTDIAEQKDREFDHECGGMAKEIGGNKERNGTVCVREPEVTGRNDVEKNIPRKKDGLPVDRGWAWFVLLGACLEMTILIGMAKSTGILFVAFQEQFHSSSSATSLISTVQNAVYSFSALTVMTVLTRRISTRYLVFFGTTIICISYIISSQATDIRLLLLSHGILQGFGTAFVQPTSISIVGQYFDKRRGLANSIAVSGGSLGGLILAPLITALLAQYGYRGCMLILAALWFHISVSAALFRPLTFYSKPTTGKQETGKPDEKLPMNGKLAESDKGTVLRSPIVNGLRQEHVANGKVIKATNGHVEIDHRLLGSEPLLSGMPKHHRKRTFTESSGSGHFFRQVSHDERRGHTSREYMAGSYMDIPGFNSANQVNNCEYTNASDEKSDEKRVCCNMFKTLSNIFDFKLFKDPVFALMHIAFGLICSGHALTTVFIVPYAREVGVDSSGVATIVAIFSAIDMCSRIGIGVIADFKFVRPSTIIAICSMFVSLASFLLKFYTSYGLVVLYAAILGLFSGGYFALFAVVIVDYMTVSKLHSCLGFTTMFHGTFVATGYIISGILRDKTGSYVASFYYLGGIIFVGGLILFVLPYVERLRDSRKEKGKEIVI